MLVFREKVNAQWLIGATLMAAGCIIVGMREKQKDEESPGTSAGMNEGEDIGLAENRKSDEDDDLIALEED